jgi:hypothetical protein
MRGRSGDGFGTASPKAAKIIAMCGANQRKN